MVNVPLRSERNKMLAKTKPDFDTWALISVWLTKLKDYLSIYLLDMFKEALQTVILLRVKGTVPTGLTPS